jgi:ferredoxin-type protein NapF
MDTSITRHQFLRGASSQRAAIHRPPWALSEPEFLERCNRCGACARACKARLIDLTDSGYPRLYFHEDGCTFCGDCAMACVTGALARPRESPVPWRLRARAGSSCLAVHRVLCSVCGERCEAGAIRFPVILGAWPVPLFDFNRCSGCGACVAACPAGAIVLAELELEAEAMPRKAVCT